jgi:hypothetical protein
MRQRQPSTFFPPVAVLPDYTTNPSFGDARVGTRDNITGNLVHNPMNYHTSFHNGIANLCGYT